MKMRLFSLTRALVARKRKIFALFFALAASIGLSWALTPLSGDTWNDATKTLTVNSNTGDNAYDSQTEIKHLIVSDAVTELGWGSFFFDSLMTTVELGNNLERIGISAFNECRSLSTITVPASVTYIGVRAFRYCTSLTTVTCKAVTPPTIGNAIFENANNLTAIYVPAASVDAYKSAWSDYASLISAPPANSITINGTPQVGDNSISLTYYFDPGNVPGINESLAPTLKVKCVTDNNWDEQWLSSSEISSGTTTITLETLGSFQAGKEYAVCYAYNNGSWVDEVFQSFSFPAAPDPAKLPGAFTINADGDKIVFSKGNLQATTTDLGANWTWKFAPNQWSLIGNAVANNAIKGNKKVSANGTVDLFGWSTAATYYGINESWKNDDYAGDFVDWGALMGTEWRTLSRAEWLYIVYDRTDAYKKHGQATVNGVPGYVLLPDAWTLPSGLSFTNSVDNYTTNQYDGADWTAMESAGAVFLPAAGVREGTDIYQVNLYGWYWASTPNETDGGKAYYLYFDKSSQGVTEYNRWKSKSVRLVTEAPIPPYEAAIKLINEIPNPVVLTAECKAKIDAARAAYDAMSDGDKDLVTNIATLTTAEAAYTALNQAEADKVVAKIAAIPQPVTLKLATRDSIESARAAYDALTADQKLLVSNYAILEAAEATWAGSINVAPAGALSGKYTINDGGDVIYFAHGNLQYTREKLDADWSTGTFRLAENQYDLIELVKTYPAAYCTDNYGDKTAVGLFGWGTWGEGKTPNLTSSDRTLYTWSTDFSGTLEGTDTWRTLTKDEWVYLLAHNNLSYATVHGVNGLLVAPDGKDIDGKSMSAWVEINDETWTTMQNDGYLFLPACGQRSQLSGANITTGGQGEEVLYYSSTEYNDTYAYNIWYKPGQDPAADDHSNKRQAFGIRLVSAGVNPLNQTQAAKDLIDAIGEVSYPDSKEAIKAAREAVDALGANASLLDDADITKLTQAEAAYAELLAQAVAAVKAAIDAVPATPLTDATKKLSEYNKVTDARALYDALSDEEKAAVTNYDKLEAAEAAFAAIGGGGSSSTGALPGKFTINESGDQISFARGNLQATTADLGEHWTWGFAANQWNYLGIAVANSKINGNGTVSENGTVDLFGWSTAATYYGINNSYKAVDYIGDFVDWGPNIGAGWRTLTKDEWAYLLQHSSNGKATVNDKNGYIFLPDNWSGPAFTANPDNFTTNVYSGDDWTAMENAGAVFLPSGPARNGTYALIANDAKYCSSTSLNNDTSYVFTIYYNQSQSACTGTNRAYGCMVRLVTAGGASPIADAQAALDKINAIPQPVVLSDECNAAIKAAREAVTALGENASLLDDADIAKLAKAEADFALLIKDAQAVMDLIDAIGDVTFSPECKAKIVAARNAYEELADELKPYVTNLATLTAAEEAYDAARPYATITTVPEAIENLYYNGLPQTLITAGAAEHGTMLYSLNGTDYSAQLPAAVLASEYTVYYKVQGTDDYKDVAPATLTAAINYNYPTTFSLFGIPEGWRVKVNGTEATVVNGAIKNIAKDDKFDVLPTKPEDVKLVEVVPYILDLSNVTDSVIYVMNGDSITGTATGNITLIILPDAKVYFKDVNLTNTGEHPAVLCGGNAEIVLAGKNTISCTTEGMFGIRAAGVGTTLTLSGNKAQLTATIDPNGGTVNQ